LANLLRPEKGSGLRPAHGDGLVAARLAWDEAG
jgi:hypothetical protein